MYVIEIYSQLYTKKNREHFLYPKNWVFFETLFFFFFIFFDRVIFETNSVFFLNVNILQKIIVDKK